MDFTTALAIELDRHDSNENRDEVASDVLAAMKGRGFNAELVNGKEFANLDSETRRTYKMRRNNRARCWERA